MPSNNPQHSPQDVSIVVATIDTPETLPEALCQWLSNNPLDIIIVTIQRDLEHVQNLVAQVSSAAGITQITTCDITNKREQLAQGIRMAKGNVVALVDDDAFWPTTTVLPYLLAGLEDPEAGGAQGKQRYVQANSSMNLTPVSLISLQSAPIFLRTDSRAAESLLGR